MKIKHALFMGGLILAGATACDDSSDSNRVAGEGGTFAGNIVETFAELDANAQVSRVGFSIPFAALVGAREDEELVAEFPEVVQGETFVNHLQLGFLSHGHAPAFWSVPHFDIHFHHITIAERESIDCSDETMPAQDRFPPNYIITSTAAEPDGTCVPAMGVHAFDRTAPEVTGDAPFTASMLLGYHDGELAFIEPMITQSTFAGQATIDLPIPRPVTFTEATRWPTRFRAVYDPARDAYDISVSGFEDVGPGVTP